jgi:threonine aldolase
MQNRFIDLYSDTKTKPSPGMRKAMAEAEVGDEQKYEDPTVERLRERVGEPGKETRSSCAGTIATRRRPRACRLGDGSSPTAPPHIINAETGGPRQLGRDDPGSRGPNGVFTGEGESRRRPNSRNAPALARLGGNTSNGGFGMWPLPPAGRRKVARARASHMDGRAF